MTRGAAQYQREQREALRGMPWWRRPLARFVDWRTMRREGGWINR